MNTHYNNNNFRPTSRLTSSVDKNGVLAKLHKTMVPPHPCMDIVLPAVSRVGDDGVDHINVNIMGLTRLGKGLHHLSPVRLDHPLFGPFDTIEGFWNWYGTEEKDDRLRTMRVGEIKRFMFINEFTESFPTDMQFRVMEACWIKIAAYPAMAQDMYDSALPFDMYHPSNADTGNLKGRHPMRIRPAFANWMIPAFEEIRLALKQGRVPDLFDLLWDEEDRARITKLTTPANRTKPSKLPKAPKQKKPKPVVETQPTENQIQVGTELQLGEVGEVVSITGIGNPSDTLTEGGQSVQELVEEQLNAPGEDNVLPTDKFEPSGPGLVVEVGEDGAVIDIRRTNAEERPAHAVASANADESITEKEA